MSVERVVPLPDQTSNPILHDIRKAREDFGQPLSDYRYKIHLPVLRHSDESPLSCRETADELDTATASFSTQIQNVFDTLITCSELDAKATEERSLHLCDNGLFLVIMTELQVISHLPTCHHRTYHSKRLVLKDPKALPPLLCVTTLRLLSSRSHSLDGYANVRPISLRVPFELLVRLPAIQNLECPWLWERMPTAYSSVPMRHYSRLWEGPWRDARHDFGRAAQEFDNTIPASLQRARLWFYQDRTGDDDQTVPMPNLVHPAEVDPLSRGLSTFASHLEELDLRAFVVPELFNAQTPWPRMKRLRVEFHPLRPDGVWYFDGPQGEDLHIQGFLIQDEHYPPTTTTQEDKNMDDKHTDYEEEYYDEDERQQDVFRTEPSTERIEPLLAAFAAKLKATPSIEEAELFAILTWRPSEERESTYYEDGAPPYEAGVHRWGVKYTAATGSSNASVRWQVGEWRPRHEILDLFEALGGGVAMTWEEFEFEDDREQDDAMAFV